MIILAGIYVSPAGAEDESLSGDTVFLQIEESVTEAVFREVSTAFADKYKPSLLQGVTGAKQRFITCSAGTKTANILSSR